MQTKILGAALGTCVHVSGLYHFLKLAEMEGYKTKFLGPAITPQRLIKAIQDYHPDLVAVSYRLTPEVAQALFAELKLLVEQSNLIDLRFVFGGTPPVVKIANESGIFERAFSGMESVEELKSYLRATRGVQKDRVFAHNLIDRIQQKYPYPLIRHHFGRPSLEETIAGVKQIVESEVLDVISLGPDQNAQEHFFRPEEMDHSQDGAGGVPVRSPADLKAILQRFALRQLSPDALL